MLLRPFRAGLLEDVIDDKYFWDSANVQLPQSQVLHVGAPNKPPKKVEHWSFCKMRTIHSKGTMPARCPWRLTINLQWVR